MPYDSLLGVLPRSDNPEAWVERMRNFRCYFIDENGATSSWRQLEHESRETAHEHALGLLPGYSPAMIVEVWEGAELTFRYSLLETQQTPSELRRRCSLAMAAASTEIDTTVKRAIALSAVSLASEAEEMERRALDGCQDAQTAATT